MKIYFATDHAGFEMKNELLDFVHAELGYEVEDCGAYELDSQDDYPDFIHKAAKAVSEATESRRAIILGGSGQGEAMVANKYDGVRAAVYYGEPAQEQIDADGGSLGMIMSTRLHNNSNVLSLGARFMSVNEAKRVVKTWLTTEYQAVDRHERRIKKIDILKKN